jgi:uncharacterized protein
MSNASSCLYVGVVVHRRVRPVKHQLRYKVYNLFVDVDELPALDRRFRFFSYNRFNIFSLSDRKFGPGDGTSIRDNVWSLVRTAGCGTEVKRIFMLCYPAVLGRVFNPLTTYYCYDAEGRVCLMIYEVSNTFGERHSYVIPTGTSDNQSHAKKFYVSPFNAVEGRYDFSAEAPAETLALGIGLRVDGAPVMQAWFKGTRTALGDAALIRSFFSLPLQPLKVMGGIHLEALKLWWKGLRLVARPVALNPNISIAEDAHGGAEKQ